MNTYILWILFLSPINGDLLESRPDSEPMSLQACIEASVERGPQVVKDGKAPVFVCNRPDAEAVTEVSI